MIPRSPLRAYVGLGIAAGIFSVSLVWGFNRLSVQQEIIHASETTGSWLAVQAEVEHLRLLNALERYGHGDPDAGRDELVRRFDIFWSRLPLLISGEESEALRRLGGVDTLANEILATLQAVEPQVMGLAKGDAAKAREIARRLEPFGDRLHQTTLSATLDLRLEYVQRRLAEANAWVFISLAGILLSAVPLILLLGRETWVRRKREQALAASEERFRRLVENAADAFFLHGPDGRIIDVNERACSSLGYRRDELVGRSMHEIEKRFDPETLAGIWARTQPGSTVTFEGIHLRRDGTTFPVEVRTGLVAGEGERYALALARDVSERKAAEERARQRQSQLTHAGRLGTLGQMATGLAHELSQPLAAISSYAQGCVQRLRGGDGRPEELLEVMEKIVAQAGRASQFIARLRGFVRREAPRRALVDVNEAVKAASELLAGEAGQRRVQVRLDLAGAVSPIVGDPIQIEQVVLNLARNGIEAMEANGVDGRVLTIRTEPADGGAVQVSVRDVGSGIAPSDLGQIFEPFFTTKSSGLGVGLSISRSIVEDHGGRIWATSTPGDGTALCFRLPAAPSSAHVH